MEVSTDRYARPLLTVAAGDCHLSPVAGSHLDKLGYARNLQLVRLPDAACDTHHPRDNVVGSVGPPRAGLSCCEGCAVFKAEVQAGKCSERPSQAFQ